MESESPIFDQLQLILIMICPCLNPVQLDIITSLAGCCIPWYITIATHKIEPFDFGILFVLRQELSLYYHTCSTCVVARV